MRLSLLRAIVFTTLPLTASAQGMLIDLGDKGTNSGYAAQSEKMEGDARRVYAYDWVCPNGTYRPQDGRVVVASDENTPEQIIQLGQRECWDAEARKEVAMVKRYRSHYYVVGGDPKNLPGGQADRGGSGAANAAAAARAAGGGIYSSCTPNPFALCSGPRPGRKDPMRSCFDFVCKFGR